MRVRCIRGRGEAPHADEHENAEPSAAPSQLWGSRSFGAKNNDPLEVLVFTSLFEKIPWLGWGVRDKPQRWGRKPFHGRNTTVNVDKIRGFRPSYAWTKTFVFFLTIAHERMGALFFGVCPTFYTDF